MNELIPVNKLEETFVKILSQLDSKTMLLLSSMACITTIICVGCVSFSGSEMTLSKTGLFITQPASSYKHCS